MFRIFMKTSLVIGVLFYALPVMALTASQVVEREVITINADGTKVTNRVAATLVTPGDKIIYSLHYHNDGGTDVDNIVLVMPVPKEVMYQEGSADRENVSTVYSTDGGVTYAVRENLLIALEDGNTRPAKSSDITHVKWYVTSIVKAGATGTLSFDARLK
ncbi:MAG: hypothetical protein COA43_01835 [Robiginitomaculum sp.]|nr:MAG: hypothetical protein COA43_01835 [Robiginitomaculum sp.]